MNSTTAKNGSRPHKNMQDIQTLETSLGTDPSTRRNDTRGSSEEEEEEEGEVTASNEYVLNVAFFSFLIFMCTQAFFAIIAKSQSMLADSLAMSVDAFTYLFNLAAERLKHRSRKHYYPDLSVEDNKRKKKMLRLYLEFFPPLISVSALIVVSVQAFMEAMRTIVHPPGMTSVGLESAEDVQGEEPNIKLMLFFSSVNLGLDVLNVTCFSKVQNFSLLGDLYNGNKDDNGQQEEGQYLSRQQQQQQQQAEEEKKALLLQSGNSNNYNGAVGNGDEEECTQEVECVKVQDPSPSKRRYEFPPSIIVDTSIDSSFESNKSSEVSGEDLGLLGISMPNYGSHKLDHEWGEEFSLNAVYGGGGAGSLSDGLTSSAASVETGESMDSSAVSSFSNYHPSQQKRKAIEIGLADELDGISEGDENEISGDHDGFDACENDDDDDDESDASAKGFNLNMCSAYTVCDKTNA